MQLHRHCTIWHATVCLIESSKGQSLKDQVAETSFIFVVLQRYLLGESLGVNIIECSFCCEDVTPPLPLLTFNVCYHFDFLSSTEVLAVLMIYAIKRG